MSDIPLEALGETIEEPFTYPSFSFSVMFSMAESAAFWIEGN
jgi:hypothetical protein